MSIKLIPTRICDGCGSEIEMDYYLRRYPEGQTVLQRDKDASPERDFCCEACRDWWLAQYATDDPWGPAWDEREWWRHTMATCDHIAVRTTHDAMPLIDQNVHFEDPEPIS